MEIEKFKILVLPLREKLLNFARSMLANDADAEDAVQEALLKLWNTRMQLLDHPNVGGFAMITIKNICIDKIRSKHFSISLDEIQIAEDNRSPYIYTEQNDNANIIKQIIETLPEIQRRTLTMRDVEGYEIEEIAAITGAENASIRVNLSRARKKVRDTFIRINQMKIEQNSGNERY